MNTIYLFILVHLFIFVKSGYKKDIILLDSKKT